MQPTGPGCQPTHLTQAAGKLLVYCVKEQFIVDVLAIWYRGPRLFQVQKEFQACRGALWPGCVPHPADLNLAQACITLHLGLGTATGSLLTRTIFTHNAVSFRPLSVLPAERSPHQGAGSHASASTCSPRTAGSCCSSTVCCVNMPSTAPT